MKIFATFCLSFLAIFGQVFAQQPIIDVLNYRENEPNTGWGYSFIHLTDTHIGEGAPNSDYGTAGLWDETPAPFTAAEGASAQRLRTTVRWINENKDALKIKFVVVTGDLTDSGELSEFVRFKEIMDSLTIPYVPLIGNHDVWPYTGPGGSIRHFKPSGDSVMNVVFKDHFQKLQTQLPDWNDGTRTNRVYNPKGDCFAYFQNYSFRYGAYQFICTDFGSREPARDNLPGVDPPADLFNFAGGSFPFLQQALSNAPAEPQHNVFMFGHWPFNEFVINYHWAFDSLELDTLWGMMTPFKNKIGAFFTGHMHGTGGVWDVVTTNGDTLGKNYWTAANKESAYGKFRLIKLWDEGFTKVETNAESRNFLNVFPNPAKDILSLVLKLPFGDQKATINLIDPLGKNVFCLEANINEQNVFTFPVSNFPKGVYSLTVQSENYREARKVVLQGS